MGLNFIFEAATSQLIEFSVYLSYIDSADGRQNEHCPEQSIGNRSNCSNHWTKAQAGDVIVLTGDLGAGKTTMTKGIALGLGISQMIKSPTYTIIREYPQGRLPLYHMDVYRVEEGADELGLDEYFEGDGYPL